MSAVPSPYCFLGCVLALQEVVLGQSPPTFSVLCYSCPYCSMLPHNVISPTMFGLPTNLTPFICHSVLLIIHLLSSIQAMCPAHFSFTLVPQPTQNKYNQWSSPSILRCRTVMWSSHHRWGLWLPQSLWVCRRSCGDRPTSVIEQSRQLQNHCVKSVTRGQVQAGSLSASSLSMSQDVAKCISLQCEVSHYKTSTGWHPGCCQVYFTSVWSQSLQDKYRLAVCLLLHCLCPRMLPSVFQCEVSHYKTSTGWQSVCFLTVYVPGCCQVYFSVNSLCDISHYRTCTDWVMRGAMVSFPSLPPMLVCGFKSWLGLEFSGVSMWHFLKLVIRGFLRVLRFPPFLRRLMVSANNIKLK